MLTRLKQHWFLLTLLGVLLLGMKFTEQVRPVEQAIPRALVVASVLFLMSVTLESRAMWLSVRHPGPAWLAVAINAGVAPPLAWLISHLLEADLGIGLIIASSVPCTMASAAVWTRRAGGNDAVSLLVTMITSVLCFLVIPTWLKLLVGQNVDVADEVQFAPLMLRLLRLAVVPIVLAQLLRQWRPAANWVDRRKKPLSALAQVGLLSVVLQGAVNSADQLAVPEGSQSAGAMSLTAMFIAVATLHAVLFALGLTVARLSRMSPPSCAAVAIAGSQKTLMIGIDVAIGFGGLAILPMVAYHATQLVMDTVLADWLRRAVTGEE